LKVKKKRPKIAKIKDMQLAPGDFVELTDFTRSSLAAR
jgi:hypothetical protein